MPLNFHCGFLAGPPPLILRAMGSLSAFLHRVRKFNVLSNVKHKRHQTKMPATPPRHIARESFQKMWRLFTARIFSFFFQHLAKLNLSPIFCSSRGAGGQMRAPLRASPLIYSSTFFLFPKHSSKKTLFPKWVCNLDFSS